MMLQSKSKTKHEVIQLLTPNIQRFLTMVTWAMLKHFSIYLHLRNKAYMFSLDTTHWRTEFISIHVQLHIMHGIQVGLDSYSQATLSYVKLHLKQDLGKKSWHTARNNRQSKQIIKGKNVYL